MVKKKINNMMHLLTQQTPLFANHGCTLIQYLGCKQNCESCSRRLGYVVGEHLNMIHPLFYG
jgi:hypothetical protein